MKESNEIKQTEINFFKVFQRATQKSLNAHFFVYKKATKELFLVA